MYVCFDFCVGLEGKKLLKKSLFSNDKSEQNRELIET